MYSPNEQSICFREQISRTESHCVPHGQLLNGTDAHLKFASEVWVIDDLKTKNATGNYMDGRLPGVYSGGWREAEIQQP
jgi:hypothetical protein